MLSGDSGVGARGRLRRVRVIELRDDGQALEAFVVVDHDLFPVAAGGTRMLPDVDVPEVARLARAMTWKFAACRVPYAGAKAGWLVFFNALADSLEQK